MDQTPIQEDSNAREAGNNREHGGHDAGDAGSARSSSRRQTSPGEASRDEAQDNYHCEKKEDVAPKDCVTRAHSNIRAA